MICRGIVRGRGVELEGELTLPEGTRVQVIAEEPVLSSADEGPMSLMEWLREARQVRKQLPETGDSTDLLRQLREGRALR